MMKNFLEEMNKIKCEVDKKLQKMENQFGEICKRQEEIIDKGIANKYHRIILNTITVGQFIKFDDNLKEHIIMELLKNTTNQKNINKAILYIKLNDLDYLSIDKKLPIIQFIKVDTRNMKITNDKIEYFYENGLLKDCLNYPYKNSITFELSYPCKNFQEIMKAIRDKKNSNKMIISLTINQKEYFKHKYQWNKPADYIIIVEFEKEKEKLDYSIWHANLHEKDVIEKLY